MRIAFTREEMKYLTKDMTIIEGCPEEIKQALEKKLELINQSYFN